MRSVTEINQEIVHVEFATAILAERITTLTEELDALRKLEEERDALREGPFATARVTKRLAAFFKDHGLYIVELHAGERTKDHYDIAKQIWRARKVLVPFARAVFAHRSHTPLTCPTVGIALADADNIKNLCDVLMKKGWLTYERQKEGFEVHPSLTGLQKQFLTSGWSEEITLYLLDKALKSFTASRRLKHKLFWDVKLKQIEPPTRKDCDMQLDLVAEVANRFYIFETKCGPFHVIDKWVDRTRLFEDEKNRFITCTANESLDPRIFFPFRLFALPTLESQFLAMLEDDFPAIVHQADCTPIVADFGKIRANS